MLRQINTQILDNLKVYSGHYTIIFNEGNWRGEGRSKEEDLNAAQEPLPCT
jgi:hypothetical protein